MDYIATVKTGQKVEVSSKGFPLSINRFYSQIIQKERMNSWVVEFGPKITFRDQTGHKN
jgi:hypothetical protein